MQEISITWIAVVYFPIFVMLGAAGLWVDTRDRRPVWFLAAAFLSNLTVAFLFVAFWHPSVRAPFAVVAPAAFVGSICWELFQAVGDIRTFRTEGDLSRAEQTWIVIVTVAFFVPAFIVAGLSAFG